MKVRVLEFCIRLLSAIERRAFKKRHALMLQLWTIRPPSKHE
jgi:hypothetical protein